MNTEQLLLMAIRASVKAGEAILQVYDSDFAVERKEDKSPLTIADKNAHAVIAEALKPAGLPLLSEEGREFPYDERKAWEHFWMVDPLDGTKEFIKRNGEFTVNIALIHDQNPLLGVIYVPVKQVVYFAAEGVGAYRCILGEKLLSVDNVSLSGIVSASHRLPLERSGKRFTIVASRSHLSEETMELVNDLKKRHGELEFISSGSSIKLCLVAEGSADIYPRFAPTMEWDTAAGQAIAEGAGKEVIDYITKRPMIYNKEELRNNWFVVK